MNFNLWILSIDTMPRLEDLTEREILRRIPVWAALAGLFLDTETTEQELWHTAQVIKEAGYSLSEVESILRQEVAPVYFWNLLSVAGEWAYFLQDEIRDDVLERLGKLRLWERIPLWRDLWYAFQMRTIDGSWNRVKSHMANDGQY